MTISPITIVKGVAWTVGFFILGQSLRIVSSVILTRLLTPEIFGILVIVFVLRNGIELLSDGGFVQSLVISKNADEPAFYNTVWSFRLARGIVLLPICIAAALPVANLYETPVLAWIMPAVGVYFLLGGGASLSTVFLQKRLQTAQLNFFQFAIEAVTTVSQVIFAYLSPTIWAVIFGGIVSAMVNLIGTYVLMPDLRHRFYISTQYAKQIFFFGKWIFVASLIFFVSSNFDSLYFGKAVSLDILGVYGIARNIADSVTGLVVKVNYTVIFPFVASHSNLPRSEFRKQLRSIRARFLLVAALGFSIMVASADLLIHLLYDQRYQNAGWMLSVMIVGRWFSMICHTNEFNAHRFWQAYLRCNLLWISNSVYF